MPNECSYQMKVEGLPENVDKFIKLLNMDYDSETKEKHFWRVFQADVYEAYINKNENTKIAIIIGDCAWSVHTCMRSGEGTYNNSRDLQGLKPRNIFGEYYTDTIHPYGTTLQEQSKLLDLYIEVYSMEPGCCFQEHYIYNRGEELCDECIPYYEWYVENQEDIDNFNKEVGLNYTFDNVEDNYIIYGGYEEWVFGGTDTTKNCYEMVCTFER